MVGSDRGNTSDDTEICLGEIPTLPDHPAPPHFLHELDDIELDLRSMLSANTVVSTSSSNDRRQAEAQMSATTNFTKIGAGACGVILAQDGTTNIIKLAKDPESDDLWNEFTKHSIIAEAMITHSIKGIEIPACLGFVPKTKENFWKDNNSLIQAAENELNTPTDALVASRIRPLPEPTRKLLIQKFCAPHIREAAFADAANKDCLVRLYLGSMQGRSSMMFFSLRNFKLHLNQLEKLQLNVNYLAEKMGEILAIMHWGAETDARDIEIVLGSSSMKYPVHSPKPMSELRSMKKPQNQIGPDSQNLADFSRRVSTLYLLDFNQVRTITLDEAGVDLAVDAFYANDPYFPRPFVQDSIAKLVWNAFVSSYKHTSSQILDGNMTLPTMFITRVMDRQMEKNLDKASKN